MLLLAGLTGCGRAPAISAGMGSKDTVQGYYEALVRRDWPQAYTTLHADSRKHCNPEQFARLAEAYRRNLGFEPDAVHVRSCEEQGTEAIAHVVLTGRASSPTRRYKDGVVLRQSAGVWQVVLPRHFGRKTS